MEGKTDGIGFYSAQEIARLGSPVYRFSFGAIVLLYGGHFKTLTVIWLVFVAERFVGQGACRLRGGSADVSSFADPVVRIRWR